MAWKDWISWFQLPNFRPNNRGITNEIELGAHTIKSHGAALARNHKHDWFILVLLVVIEVILNVIHPFYRFVGEDMMDDLKYPMKDNTVPVWAVPLYAVLLPITIFILFYLRRKDVYDLHHSILGLLFAVLITGVLTDAIKDAVGRPRPDFYWRCFPNGNGTYDHWGNVKCYGKDSDIKEGHKSFPSGHTSWSFAGLGFLSLYLAGKIKAFDGKGHVAKLCIVVLPLLLASLVAVSRVDDYWHHWQDVFTGGLLGLVVATFCYLQFFPPPYDTDGWGPYAYFRALGETDTGLQPVHTANELEGAEAVNLQPKLEEAETIRRRMGLTRVDKELSKGNYKTALSLVKRMQGSPGGLRGFAAAKQVPWQISSFNDLGLSEIDISSLESTRDLILRSIESRAKLQLSNEVSLVDLDSLMHGRTYESLCQHHLMCMQHESGHFLVGYLLGILPKGYTVSKMEALKNDKLGVAGGCVQFFGFEFLGEVHSVKQLRGKFSGGRLHDELLDKFMCVMLAGLVAEHLVFGYSQGLHSDLDKLEKVVKWMRLTDMEADNGIKWAITNTITILNRHQEARSRLAEAMGLGKSVGSCIDVIENTINNKDI